MHRFLLVFATMLFLTACGSAEFEPGVMNIDSAEDNRYEMQKECVSYYENADGAKLNIAIFDFSNNTLYSNQYITQNIRNEVEEMFSSVGGYRLISVEPTRGVTIPTSQKGMEGYAAVLGIDFMITGSIDSISAELTGACNDQNKCLYSVVTNLTINVTNIKTSELTLRKHIKATSRIVYTDHESLSSEKVLSTVNIAIKKALATNIKQDIIEAMPVRAYVVELRGRKSAALINSGKNSGVDIDTEFRPYEMSLATDYATGQTHCHLTPLPFTMITSKYINETGTWLMVNTDNPYYLNKLKVGTLVQRIPSSER